MAAKAKVVQQADTTQAIITTLETQVALLNKMYDELLDKHNDIQTELDAIEDQKEALNRALNTLYSYA